MTDSASSGRIEAFHEIWNENTQSLLSSPQSRRDVEDHLTTLLTRIDQEWYDPEDVLHCAEETITEISEALTPRLESVASNSIRNLIDQISNVVDSDRLRLADRPNLQNILTENIDSDSLEDTIEDTDYSIQSIKSTLFGEVASISRREEKKALEIYDIAEQIRDCRDELDSSEFKTHYRSEMVELIERFLRQEDAEESPEVIVPELLGELRSAGWEADSMEEVIGILESAEEIEEFCDVLRGQRYWREYCVPLPADRISEPHQNVAGVDFYMRGSDEFTYLDDLVDADERAEQAVELSTQDTDFFAIVEIVAPTQEVGEKRMETKLERAIDALNYAKSKGVVQSPFTQFQTTYLCRLPDGRYNIHTSKHHKYALPHSFNVPDDGVEYLEEQFEFFDHDYDDQTRLERRFIQSYRWYGDGIQSGVPEDEFLKYIIAMESMLVPEVSGPKKSTLAGRLAVLFGIYDTYRDSFKDEVTALYDTRSALVHSAEIDILDIDQEVSSARSKATKMFGVILEDYIDHCENVQELLDELEELEVPEEPEDHNPFGIG